MYDTYDGLGADFGGDALALDNTHFDGDVRPSVGANREAWETRIASAVILQTFGDLLGRHVDPEVRQDAVNFVVSGEAMRWLNSIDPSVAKIRYVKLLETAQRTALELAWQAAPQRKPVQAKLFASQQAA